MGLRRAYIATCDYCGCDDVIYADNASHALRIATFMNGWRIYKRIKGYMFCDASCKNGYDKQQKKEPPA